MTVLNQTGGEETAAILSTGVGEAGRSSLIGSVFAATVILPEHFDLPGLTDSEKLSRKKRDISVQMTKEQVAMWSITFVDPDEISQLDILRATMVAMKHAIGGLSVVPDKVWINGNRVPRDPNVPAETVVKDDNKVIEISAAPVLTRTTRDAEMYELVERYPQYELDRHKGYGMAQHLTMLKQYDVLPGRHRDFTPVKALLAQDNLFEK